jgi:transcription elongation GreA/GreB family factor
MAATWERRRRVARRDELPHARAYIRSMTRAFTKEADADALAELPDRAISSHPNLMTAEGLALIEAELARQHEAHALAQANHDRTGIAKAARELRYWTARRASAEVIAPPQNAKEVHFGSTVTIARDDGRRQTFRIVGEDEADPAKGTISHVSPLARALYGKSVGDVVMLGENEVEVREIR